MTGRGVDQILPHPSDPRLHEEYVRDAGQYVQLAEAANGPLPRRVDLSYIWGDALDELARLAPRARLVNLETSITRSDAHWPGKGIHYRMHPENARCLAVARIDVCVLANNHVLDFGEAGLLETMDTLAGIGVRSAGAGRTLDEAREPARVGIPGEGRLLVLAFGHESSGIPSTWSATDTRPGLDVLPDLSEATARRVLQRVQAVKRARDIVVASIHWGDNWGYEVPPAHRRFAHSLLDGGVDIVHGHSSHHVRPIERHRGKLILYGCGDVLNDYEGIPGHESFRDDLALMYFPTVDAASGRLESLRMTPMQIRNLRLNRACAVDADWIARTVARISRPFGAHVELAPDGTLALHA
jgi:poly-gamma-glutamate synthesis protein (capsule biosynthesis protein)